MILTRLYNMLIRLVIISIWVFFCVSFSAMGQTMSDEMSAIVRSTIAADGSINREKHRRFWELARKEFNIDLDYAISDVQNFAKNLRELTLGMQRWQNEVWKSARMSNLEGSVVETQLLKELRANMLGNQKAAAYSIWGTGAEEYMKVFETQWNSVAIPNTRELLIAASKSDTVSSMTGETTQPITLELIDFTIASIKESYERALKLMNPIWSANFSDSRTSIIGRSDKEIPETESSETLPSVVDYQKYVVSIYRDKEIELKIPNGFVLVDKNDTYFQQYLNNPNVKDFLTSIDDEEQGNKDKLIARFCSTDVLDYLSKYSLEYILLNPDRLLKKFACIDLRVSNLTPNITAKMTQEDFSRGIDEYRSETSFTTYKPDYDYRENSGSPWIFKPHYETAKLLSHSAIVESAIGMPTASTVTLFWYQGTILSLTTSSIWDELLWTRDANREIIDTIFGKALGEKKHVDESPESLAPLDETDLRSFGSKFTTIREFFLKNYVPIVAVIGYTVLVLIVYLIKISNIKKSLYNTYNQEKSKLEYELEDYRTKILKNECRVNELEERSAKLVMQLNKSREISNDHIKYLEEKFTELDELKDNHIISSDKFHSLVMQFLQEMPNRIDFEKALEFTKNIKDKGYISDENYIKINELICDKHYRKKIVTNRPRSWLNRFIKE